MHPTRAIICGAPFAAIFHHDGRFVRAAGVFAFGRRCRQGFEILHLEWTDDIHRRARPDHPRWAWALAAGMDTLLVHVPGSRSLSAAGELAEITWAAGAHVRLGGEPRSAPPSAPVTAWGC
jgi:hypothetical protein